MALRSLGFVLLELTVQVCRPQLPLEANPEFFRTGCLVLASRCRSALTERQAEALHAVCSGPLLVRLLMLIPDERLNQLLIYSLTAARQPAWDVHPGRVLWVTAHLLRSCKFSHQQGSCSVQQWWLLLLGSSLHPTRSHPSLKMWTFVALASNFCQFLKPVLVTVFIAAVSADLVHPFAEHLKLSPPIGLCTPQALGSPLGKRMREQ